MNNETEPTEGADDAQRPESNTDSDHASGQRQGEQFIAASDHGPETGANISPEGLLKDFKRDGAKFDTPYRCLRGCLEQSFDAESIRAFCHTFFSHVHKRIEEFDGFDRIITRLINHCEQQGTIQYLWELLKQEYKSHYDDYYPRWVRAVAANESIRPNEYALVERNSTSEAKGESRNTPLSKDEPDLTRWFFNELDADEQSLLLAVALFDGMSRQKLVSTAQVIEDVVRPE